MKKIIVTTGVIAVAGGLATALTMSSCDQCDVAPKPSVIVQLVAQDGAALDALEVDGVWYEWTKEDGSTVKLDAECLNPEQRCSDWQLGDGQAGEYVFHAEVCGEQFDSAIAVDLNDDGCEVDTRIVELPISADKCLDIGKPDPANPHPTDIQKPGDGPQLPPTPTWKAPSDPKCTMQANFSVVANLTTTDVHGAIVPLSPEKVSYTFIPAPGEGSPVDQTKAGAGAKGEKPDHSGERELKVNCFNRECSSFFAGIETEGEFIITAKACGEAVQAIATVGRTEDGCHVDTQFVNLEIDGEACRDLALEATPVPDQRPECPVTAPIPSAYLLPVVQEGDMLRPWPTRQLMYEKEDPQARPAEAFCAMPASNGRCSMWVAGFGEYGMFKAWTEACAGVSEVSYTVDPAADGCGPQTSWVTMTVDTKGCVQPPVPGVNPPPPSTAAEGTDVLG